MIKIAQFIKNSGYSFGTETFFVSVKGKIPYNVDVMHKLENISFKFLDDEGKKHTDGRLTIQNHDMSRGHFNHLQEKQGYLHESIYTVNVPKRATKEAYLEIQKSLKSLSLTTELLSKYRKPEIVIPGK